LGLGSALARFFSSICSQATNHDLVTLLGKKGVVAVIPLNKLPSRLPTPHDGLILYNKRDDVAGEDF
jgi:hypothetical protein